MSDRSRRGRADLGCTFVALGAASLGVALALNVFVQRPVYARLLSPETARLAAEESLLLAWTPWAATLLALSPSIALGVAVTALGAGRAGKRAFAALASVTIAFVALDVESYSTFGRHLAELSRLALTGAGIQAVGDVKPWAFLAVRWLAIATVGVFSVTYAVHFAVTRLWESRTPIFRRALVGITGAILAVLGFAPHLASASWRNRSMFERLYGALPFDPRPKSAVAPPPLFDDPNWRKLEGSMRHAYARAFPLLFAPRAPIDVAPPAGARPPDVVLFVLESLRADVFTPEYFPRLSEWSKRGVVARRHFGGSNSSEAGMFAIFYGRTPLEYHAALDGGEPPVLCQVAHRLGYVCAYFSGQPEAWDRVEQFLNPHAIDVYVHDDRGDWPAWDRTATANLVRYLARQDRKPVVAVVYLMATHFPYEYPPEDGRAGPVVPFDRGTHFLDVPRDDYPKYKNRYANSLAFTDDLIAGALAKIDSEKTTVFVTGDHGESLGEDGRLGHGYGFSDAVSLTPLAAVGPGVPVRSIAVPTEHVDLLPTFVEIATGHEPAQSPFQGRSLLSSDAPRGAVLLARCSLSRDQAEALFVVGARRIRFSLGLRAPEVNFKGLEDPLGRPMDLTGFTEDEADAAGTAFQAELDVARR